MKAFFDKAASQHHPLRLVHEFLEQEDANEKAKKYDALRFVGYVLEIGYDTVTIITSDPFKVAVGGVPRNSLLVMIPSVLDSAPPHFTLLRVLETAATPLSRETQQTYFELQKKSMPELDVFTQSELQWGALKTGVLGMFYPHPLDENKVEFSGDVNNFVSAHKYKVYSPTDKLLDLVINTLVPNRNRFVIGDLRLTECRLPLPGSKQPNVEVNVSTDDFMGARTAMFGKTRLGKSNVVKLIAQSILETTKTSKNVGQLIFDINGEYANDNPQDSSLSLASAYKDQCDIYALTKKENTESKPLKIDFYEHPEASMPVLRTLMQEGGRDSSNYVKAFLSVDLPSIDDVHQMHPGEKTRAKRKILMYWAILHRAGFNAETSKLYKAVGGIDPDFNEHARERAYGPDKGKWPQIKSLDDMAREMELLIEEHRKAPIPSSTKGKNLFESDEEALLGFLKPKAGIGSGTTYIQPYRKYHDPKAGNFVDEIIGLLDQGRTVILDLGNAPPELMEYFSVLLSTAVFHEQVNKFSNNKLGNKFIQVYFEEAHNLFAANDSDERTKIYRRLAKEGAKYHIGMVYSTQSVTTVSKDLLAQTENFFIAHVASQTEVNALATVNIAYESMKDDIMLTKTPGYIRMLTQSHRFVVPMQAKKFEATAPVKMKAAAK
ncbi:MAG: ATP-binding protein [Terriglobales bacterium]